MKHMLINNQKMMARGGKPCDTLKHNRTSIQVGSKLENKGSYVTVIRRVYTNYMIQVICQSDITLLLIFT